jgi:hypothetical protein
MDLGRYGELCFHGISKQRARLQMQRSVCQCVAPILLRAYPRFRAVLRPFNSFDHHRGDLERSASILEGEAH